MFVIVGCMHIKGAVASEFVNDDGLTVFLVASFLHPSISIKSLLERVLIVICCLKMENVCVVISFLFSEQGMEWV